MIKKFLATIIFIGLYQLAVAQCTEALTLAANEFEAGHLNNISAILGECIKKGSTEQKVEALKLLTITYLYLDDPYAAEKSFMDLLEVDPEFRVSPGDPVELEHLSRKFIASPIISYMVKAGINFSAITVLNRNTLGNENESNWRYRSKVGAVAQAGFDLHFNKALSLGVEAEFSMRSYSLADELFPDDQHDLLEIRQNIHGSLPVTFKYTIDFGGKHIYYPYIYAGYSPSYTFTSYSSSQRDPQTAPRVEGTRLNMKPSVSLFSHSLLFGVGLKRRIKYRYVLIDFRYRLGMTNMLLQDNQYDFTNQAIKDYTFRYAMIPDDYRWNTFELAIGYVWPKYQPRTRNTVTIQTIFKKWFGMKSSKSDE